MEQKNCVRTRERDTLEPRVRERGVRCWKRVELLGDNWFYLETVKRLETGDAEPRKFIVADFWEAMTALKQSNFESATLYMCLRSPLRLREGLAFQEVEEAYRLTADGGVLLRFGGGLMCTSGKKGFTSIENLEVLEKVYPMRH